MIEKRDSWG